MTRHRRPEWGRPREACLPPRDMLFEYGFDRCYGFNTSHKDDQGFEHVAERLGARVPTIVMLGDKKED